MSMYDIDTTPIEGMQIITPKEEGASRDFLFTLNTPSLYQAMGIDEEFAQHSLAKYARGVMRGLYLQRQDSAGVLLAVTTGRVLAVGVDMRPESRTFGASHSVELTAENERMFYIPPYFAHGFMTLEQNTEVVCNYTREYDPACESSIIWDDEILSIDWQFERFDIDKKRLSMLPKDKRAPSFRSYNQNTLWPNRPKKSRYAISK